METPTDPAPAAGSAGTEIVQCVHCHSFTENDGATGFCRLFGQVRSTYHERSCDRFIYLELVDELHPNGRQFERVIPISLLKVRP